MRLSCQKFIFAVLVATLACSDNSGPPSITAGFSLDNVDGRPLPTFDSPIPEAPTILSVTLQFEASGFVVMTERRQDITRGEFTTTSTLDYKMTGPFIEIGCFRGLPIVACPHYAAILSGDGLSLTDLPSQSVIYNYTQFASAL